MIDGRIEAALAALEPQLQRLDRLIEREIKRLRARYELSLDEFRGLYVSDRQVDELLGASRSADHADARSASNGAADVDPLTSSAPAPFTPWEAIAALPGVGADALDMVLLALAPEVDAKYETLFAYLNNDVTRKLPTAELAGRLFGNSRSHRTALRGALAPGAAVMRHGLIEFAPSSRELPHAQRGFMLAPPLVGWLQGLAWSDERLTGIAAIDVPDAGPALAVLAPDTARIVANAARSFRDEGAPVLVCTAPTPGEAALVAEALFAAQERAILSIDLAALRGSAAAPDVLAAAALMQYVLGVGIIAAPTDALLDVDQRVVEAGAALLRQLIMRASAIALAGTPAAPWRDLVREQRAVEIRAHELPPGERARVWRAAVGDDIDDDVVEALADRFVLGADRIARAACNARDAAAYEGRGDVSARELYEAARRVSSDAAGSGVTRVVDATFGWDDLVVPHDVRTRLTELVRAVELRPRVLGHWGFGARLGGAHGIKVLFAGASGTGKTMAAAIIARTLGLELHRIDLAATVSKYIGETEKNLDRAFAAARRANAILFIDEAEALLGKRSEVKDAHDRYANVEIAYLLQRMEEHDGVVILATNLAQNIDEAFSRRMHYVVDFPIPDVGGREALWRRMIPPEAPLADDVDFGFLARRFVLSGGDIRNVVLDAAYRAAQAGDAIGMPHMLHAVIQQFAKRGKVPPAGEFREYAGLLAVAAEPSGVSCDPLSASATARTAPA